MAQTQEDIETPLTSGTTDQPDAPQSSAVAPPPLPQGFTRPGQQAVSQAAPALPSGYSRPGQPEEKGLLDQASESPTTSPDQKVAIGAAKAVRGLYHGAMGDEESETSKGKTTTASPAAANLGFTPEHMGHQAGAMVHDAGKFIYGVGKDLNSPMPVVSENEWGSDAKEKGYKGPTFFQKYVEASAAQEKQEALDEATKFHQTQGWEAFGHALNSYIHTAGEFVPMAGPFAAQLIKKAQGGDVGGAMAQVAALKAGERAQHAVTGELKTRAGKALEEAKETPQVTQAKANVDALGKELAKKQTVYDTAKAAHDQYAASHAQGIAAPKNVGNALAKASEELEEAQFHHDSAAEALKKAKVAQPSIPQQVGSAAGKAVAKVLPKQPAPAEVPTQEIEAAPAPPPLKKLGQTQPPINVKTPGQIQPETIQQTPTDRPTRPLGRINLADSQGTVGTQPLLGEGTPEGPQVPAAGLPKMKQEVLPPEKPAVVKPERGNVKALTVDEKGNVLDKESTPEGRLQKLLEESLKDNEAKKTAEPVVKPEVKAEKPAEAEPAKPKLPENYNPANDKVGVREKMDYDNAMEKRGAEEDAKKTSLPKDESIPKREPWLSGSDYKEDKGTKAPEEYTAPVQEQVNALSDENLKKLAKAHNLNPEDYDFKARDERRHRTERNLLVQHIVESMGDDEKTNLGRATERVPDEGLFENAAKTSKSKAERAASLFPRLRGPVDEFGNPKVSGGTPAVDTEAEKLKDVVKKSSASDTDHMKKAMEELGPDARLSDIAARAQKLKEAANQKFWMDPNIDKWQPPPELGVGSAEDVGKRVRAKNPEPKGRGGEDEGNRRKVDRAAQAEDQKYFNQARKELGEDASSDAVSKRMGELKASAGKPVDLKKVIEEHNKQEGLGEVKDNKLEVDPRRKEISKAYDDMKHDPSDPAVKKSYDSLISDTKKQWDSLEKAGVKFEPTDEDPYKSYDEMKKDFTDNKRMKVFRGGNELPEDHPLAKVDPKTGETYNVMFRAVHDAIGHLLHDNDFSEKGEENAYDTHRQTMAKESVPAMSTETKGQVASYFDKDKGEFPEQKAGIMSGFEGEKPAEHEVSVKRSKGFSEFGGDQGVYDVKVGPLETQMFRDPENGSWYEHGTGRHFSENYLGYNKVDALETLKGRAKDMPKVNEKGSPVDEFGNPNVSGGSQSATAKAKPIPTSKQMLDKYGESSGDPAHTAFLLSDGKGVKQMGLEHSQMAGGVDNLPKFINQEGAIRMRSYGAYGNRQFNLSLPEKGVTLDQLKELKRMAPQISSGKVYIEAVGNKPVATADDFREVEHGKASDDLEKTIREMVPVLNDKGSPVDEFGNPTVSGGSPATGAAEAKSKPLPKLAEEHLTEEERAGVTKSNAGRTAFVENLKKLPSVQEFTDIAKAGEGGRKWYQRSAAAFDALTEEAPRYFKDGDRQKFTDFLAALSPQQSVKMNLGEALNAWTRYVDEGRPTGKPLEKLLRDELTLSGAKIPNATKALAGEPLWPDLSKNANFKVPSFAKNLNGYLNHVTNDGWQALFGGLDGKEIARANSYHPLAVVTRAAADALGWEPAEAQAAIWAFTKTFTEKGETEPADVRRRSEDFADIIAMDPEIRQQLAKLGVNHEQLDAKLRAIGKKPPVTPGASPTTENSVRKLKSRIEGARGKGVIPAPKSGNLNFEPDEETEFNPEDFDEADSKLEKLGKKKSPLGRIK